MIKQQRLYENIIVQDPNPYPLHLTEDNSIIISNPHP